MFSDFDERAKKDEGRGRRTVSLLLAGGVFSLLALAIAAAVAIRHEIVRQERDLDVAFAVLEDVPEPVVEPEPEPERPQEARPRPAAATDGPPASIPDTRPPEADGALATATDVGPVDGTYGGVEGGEGTGPAPRVEPELITPPPPAPPPGPPRPPRPPAEQERVEVRAPSMLSGCRTPERPASLEGATAETIRIRVRVVIGPDGRVLRATLVETHPLVPEETILGCVTTRVYQPATIEGTPVPYVLSYVFTFRPDAEL
ncbi:MAG: hypothetical protein KF729_15665 [Sandaracinaceae bacterium]|nr:hypothetical protein [Sandaracinaceae bacterium]